MKSELTSAIIRDPLQVTPNSLVKDVIAKMSEFYRFSSSITFGNYLEEKLDLESRGSCALIVENHQLLGIFTERDAVRLCREKRPLETLTIGEVMFTPVITFPESDLTDLFSLSSLIQKHNIRHLPIVDETGKVVGLLTHNSLRQRTGPLDLLRLCKVIEVMTSPVIYTFPETSIIEIANMMFTHHISCIVIVNKKTNNTSSLLMPVGMITEGDIVQLQALNLNLETCQAQEIMNTPLFTVNQHDSLLNAQKIMEKNWIQRLVVTGKKGELVGIITPTSILRAINPVELYKLAQILEQKVAQLEAEKIALLETRTLELEKKVEESSTILTAKETALIESQNRYVTLAESVPVGIFRADLEGNCLDVNPCWCKITGLTSDEAMGKGWINALHPEDRDKIIAQWYLAVQEKRPLQLEYRYQSPDGLITWVLGQVLTEYDLNGEIIGFVGTITDITERQQINEIIENLIQGTFTVTGGDFFPALAEHITKAFQFDRVVIIELREGQLLKLVDWLNPSSPVNNIHRNDPQSSPENQLISEDLSQLKQQSDLTLTLHNHDGYEIGYIAIWKENFQEISPLGNISDTLRIFSSRAEAEIERIRINESLEKQNQERQKAQKELEKLNQSLEQIVQEQTREIFQQNILHKAILDGTDYAIITTDSEGIIKTFNQGAERLLGYSSEEVINKMTPDIFHDPQELKDRAQKLSQELNSPITPGFEICIKLVENTINTEQEWTYVRKDGSRFPVSLSLNSLSNSQGIVTGFLGIAQDISKRKEAEEKLQKLSHRLGLALQSGAFGCWEWDISSNTIIWDERMYQLYGYEPQSLPIVTYENWVERLHPEDRSLTEKLLKESVLERAEYNIEFRVIHGDGSIHFIKAFGLLIKDEKGHPQRIIGINFDITESKHTQENLQAERTRLQLALDAANMGTWSFNINTGQLLCSKRTEEIFGFLPGTFVGDRSEFLSMIYPEDRELLIESINHTLKTGDVYHLEYRIYRLDGQMRWIEAWGMIEQKTPIKDREIIGVVMDITDAKETQLDKQKLLRELSYFKQGLDEAAIVTITDSQGKITYVNNRFCQISGYSREEIIGQSHYLLKSHYHSSDFFSHIWEEITQGKIWCGEICNQTKTGDLYWLETTIIPFFNHHGEPFQYLAIRFDITQRKLAESELKQKVMVIETAINGIGVMKEEQYIYLNPSYLLLFGYEKPEDLLGKSWRVLYDQPSLEKWEKEILPILKQEKIWRGELIATRRDGSTFDQNLSLTLTEEGLMIYVCDDISDRRKVERENQRLKERLEFVLSANPAVIYTCNLDENYRQTFISDNIRIIAGYDPEQFLSDSQFWLSHLHPEDQPKIPQEFHQLFTQDFHTYDYRFRHQEGHYIWIRDGMRLVRDSQGNPIEIVGFFTDISHLKETEIALQESERHWRFALEGSGDGVWDWDLEKNTIFFSSQWKAMLGYTNEELENTLEEWNNRLHPDDQDQFYEALSRHFRGETLVYENEHRLRCKDGNYKWILDRGKVMIWGENGQPLRVIGTHTDINQRKEAERELENSKNKFQRLIEDMGDQFVVFSHTDHVLTYVSSGIEKIVGISQEDAIGQRWDQLLNWFSGESEKAHQIVQKMLEDSSNFLPFEMQFIRTDGQIRVLSISQHCVWNDRQEVIAIEGVAEDITERKQAQIALQKSENRFRRVFSSNIVGMMFTDFTGKITDANDRFLEMIGYSREDLNNHLINWKELTPPKYSINDQQSIEHLKRYGVIDPWEKEYYHKQGHPIPILLAIALLSEEDTDDSCVCIILDISDRKKAEQSLTEYAKQVEDLYNNAPCGYHSLDSEGRYIQVNETELKMLGYSREELLGKPIREFLTPASRENFMKDSSLYLQQDFISNLEYDIVCKDGSIRPIITNVTAVKDEEGNYFLYSRATMLDISERKRTEQIINQQVQKEKLLREITQRIRESLDLNTIFQTACQEIRSVILADRVGIFKFYPESNFDTGEFVAESVLEPFPSVMKIRVNDHCFGDNYADLYAHGRYFVVDDIYQAKLRPCHRDILAEFQIRATLIIPLLCGHNRLWGLLCIHQCSTSRQWQQSELDLLQQIANQLAIGIQQADLYDKIQSELLVRQKAEKRIALQLKQQQTLGNINQQIRESLDITEILTKVIAQVKNVLHCDRVIVFQLFSTGKSHIVQEWVSEPFPSLKNLEWENEVWSQEILDFYWKGQPRIVPDVMNDQWTDCLSTYNLTGEIKSKIVAPILQEIRNHEENRWIDPGKINKLWGILVVHSCTEKRVWQESEAQVLQQIANQLAIAIQQAHLFEQLQEELTERQFAQKQLINTNQKLALSNEQLARATRMKDEFLANMSHELRTPLNAILGMSEALQEELFGPLNEKQHQSINTIENSGVHLLALINDILDVAKIESGKIQLNCTTVSLNKLCESSLVFVKQQAQQKRIKIQVQIPRYLPDLSVDERRIRQVLINLLNNAIKFTPEGGQVSLSVHLESTPGQQNVNSNPMENSQPTSQIWVTITDNGIGITQENLAKLFQPFVQIDSALNRQYAGTGLGLTLVKRIVEMHGGQVSVHSKIGVGSSFSFSLPCDNLLLKMPEVPSSKSLESDLDFAIQEVEESALILLAEDNDANILTISRYLKAKGYKMLLAKNGQEAIDLAKSRHPDLILMDIQMPGMDGLEAITRIRQDSSPKVATIPIIALTALAMTGDKEKCLEAGANNYLSKPIKLSQLRSIIRDILTMGKKS